MHLSIELHDKNLTEGGARIRVYGVGMESPSFKNRPQG
jgi:hypothetical protein